MKSVPEVMTLSFIFRLCFGILPTNIDQTIDNEIIVIDYPTYSHGKVVVKTFRNSDPNPDEGFACFSREIWNRDFARQGQPCGQQNVCQKRKQTPIGADISFKRERNSSRVREGAVGPVGLGLWLGWCEGQVRRLVEM